MTDKPAFQETILVVEDDVLVRMPIAQYLRDCGYRVIEAVSADEAMAVFDIAKRSWMLFSAILKCPGLSMALAWRNGYGSIVLV